MPLHGATNSYSESIPVNFEPKNLSHSQHRIQELKSNKPGSKISGFQFDETPVLHQYHAPNG